MQQAGDIRISTPLYGGSFSSDSGATLSFVLPGELVRLNPEVEIVTSAPVRTAPGCVHFSDCGGCQYQHASYPAQLELKRTILRDLLLQASLGCIPKIEVISGTEWHYRNRIRLRIEPGPEGFRAGYSLRRSNNFLPIWMCPIAAPVLWRAAETITSSLDPLVRCWLAVTSELELLTTPDESRLQLQFFLRSPDSTNDAASFIDLCARLKAEISELAGAGAGLDPDADRRFRRRFNVLSWGAAGLNYVAAGRTYWLPREAFFQVNRYLVDRLVALVTEGISGELAWDLYAGVGLFTRALADSFARVVAVEGAPAAIASLQAAARSTAAIEPVHSPTLDFLQARVLERERPSLIVLDPPRAGIGQEAATLLNRIAAEQVVYVSCDPTTLTRDLTTLTKIYAIESIHLIDLFPQTFHLETIVHLRRRTSSLV